MTDREAMKLALEVLEGIHVGNMTPMAEENWNKAIAVLRQALEQHILADSIRPKGKSITKVWVDEINQALDQPEREWVGLNVVEIGRLTVFDGLHHVDTLVLADFIRAIEAKLKEKNT